MIRRFRSSKFSKRHFGNPTINNNNKQPSKSDDLTIQSENNCGSRRLYATYNKFREKKLGFCLIEFQVEYFIVVFDY